MADRQAWSSSPRCEIIGGLNGRQEWRDNSQRSGHFQLPHGIGEKFSFLSILEVVRVGG